MSIEASHSFYTASDALERIRLDLNAHLTVSNQRVYDEAREGLRLLSEINSAMVLLRRKIKVIDAALEDS
jgi:hypothetical protein